MNFGIIFRLQGVIVFSLGIAFLVCFGVSLFPSPIANEVVAERGFLTCAALAFVLAIGLILAGRGCPPRMFRREALCVIGTGWIVATLVGALPYIIIDKNLGVIDAIFESASGLTTTGASVYANVELLPRSLLFWRALSQWIGGMGVVVFFVAILGFLGAGGKILYSNEASGSTADFDEPRVQSAVLNLWLVYLGLSAICALVFWVGGMSVYDALCHMFATVSTGGFSTRNSSMGAFDSPFLEWSTTVFMITSGTSFMLLARTARGQFDMIRRNSEAKAFVLILLISSIAIAVFLLTQGGKTEWHEAFRDSAFQVASIMTTTGFATDDYDFWPTFPKVLLLVLMIIGGCSASTAGGVKLGRVVIAWKVILRGIEKEFRPRVVRMVRINGKPVDDEAVRDVLIFLVLVALLCVIAVSVTAAFEPNLSVQASVSSVFASLFNIGPGLGELGPTDNYSGLHDYTKVMLSMLMIMGRLELYALLVLFSPQLWRSFR
jgi:trk system potassium uptake protein TrkH